MAPSGRSGTHGPLEELLEDSEEEPLSEELPEELPPLVLEELVPDELLLRLEDVPLLLVVDEPEVPLVPLLPDDPELPDVELDSVMMIRPAAPKPLV